MDTVAGRWLFQGQLGAPCCTHGEAVMKKKEFTPFNKDSGTCAPHWAVNSTAILALKSTSIFTTPTGSKLSCKGKKTKGNGVCYGGLDDKRHCRNDKMKTKRAHQTHLVDCRPFTNDGILPLLTPLTHTRCVFLSCNL